MTAVRTWTREEAAPSELLVRNAFVSFRTRLPADLLEHTAKTFRALGMAATRPSSADYFSYSLKGPGRDRRTREKYFDLEHGGRFLSFQIFPPAIHAMERAQAAGSEKARAGSLRSDLGRLAPLYVIGQDEHGKDGLREHVHARHARMMERNVRRLRSCSRHLLELGRCFARIRELLCMDPERLVPGLHFLTSYSGSETVFGLPNEPSHRDAFVTRPEVLMSIQLTEAPCDWLIGRERDSLVRVTQHRGDVIVLDNFGSHTEGDPRRNPIHHVTAGPAGRNSLLLSFTGRYHARALRYLDTVDHAW